MVKKTVSWGFCGGFVRICILRAILFLAYPTSPPAHKVLLGGAWGGAGELMPLDGAGGRKGPGESGRAEIVQISFCFSILATVKGKGVITC